MVRPFSRVYRTYHPRVGITQLLVIKYLGQVRIYLQRDPCPACKQTHLAWLLPLIVSLSLELISLIDYLIHRVINLAGVPLQMDTDIYWSSKLITYKTIT